MSTVKKPIAALVLSLGLAMPLLAVPPLAGPAFADPASVSAAGETVVLDAPLDATNFNVNETGAAPTFADNAATWQGGGPNNFVASKESVTVEDFTYTVRFRLNSGHTKGSVRIGFGAAAADAEGGYVLDFVVPHNKAVLRLPNNKELTGAGNVRLAVGTDYTAVVQRSGDEFTFKLDDRVLFTRNITDLPETWYPYVSGRFPGQSFTVTGVTVTTPKKEVTPPPAAEHTLTLKTVTDGVEGAADGVGGSVTASRTTGVDGDEVTLTPTAKPGYRFTGYTTGVDGVPAIVDNQFTFSDDAGDVTVTANFAADQAPAGDTVVFDGPLEAPYWNVGKTNWTSLTFADDTATWKGGGPNNFIASKASVAQSNFTYTVKFRLNEGHDRGSIRIGFGAPADDTIDGYVLDFAAPHRKAFLQAPGVDGNIREAAAPLTIGTEYTAVIEKDGDNVTFKLDDRELFTYTIADFSTPWHPFVAGKWPSQSFSVTSVKVTTPETVVVTPDQYTLTLQTNTDGEVGPAEGVGGTVTASRMTGNSGDVVILTPTAKDGYVFTGYSNNQDGLLTISNNSFAFNDKTGDVTVTANFITRPVDENAILEQRFGSKDPVVGSYTTTGETEVVDNQLLLRPGTDPAVMIGEPIVELTNGDYKVLVDAQKVSATEGTYQIAFRVAASGDAQSDMMVLELANGRAKIKKITSSGEEELADAEFVLGQEMKQLQITVMGGTISVAADDQPVMSHQVDDFGNTVAGFVARALTPGANLVIDNVTVAAIPIKVTTNVTVTAEGQPDPNYEHGAISLEKYRVSSGQEIRFTPIPKGGYRLESVTINGEKVSGNTWQVPLGTDTDISLVANFIPTVTTPTTYYVDSVAGSDSNEGTSEATPWQTLGKLAEDARIFNPGDKILLKKGSVFTGEASALRFKGSGTEANPILVGSYGEGNRPRLDGAGAVENVVQLNDQEWVTLSGMEITNVDTNFRHTFEHNRSNNREKNLRAIHIIARNFGVVNGITIRDNYLHDVTGNLNVKWNGGIFVNAGGNVEESKLYGIPTKYDRLLIENNVLENLDRSGMKLVGSTWSNQWAPNNPNTPVNWYPSTKVVVRNNILRKMGGDAITVRDTDGALVEYNLVDNSRYQLTAYNAGIWAFEAMNSVIQYNEVSRTRGIQDGQGLDADHASGGTVIQYNYSHDNEGGFVLIMNGYPHTAPTVRFNVSQNDKDKTFEFSRGTPRGTAVYNNTIFTENLLDRHRAAIWDLANTGAGLGNHDAFFFNNIFYYPEGQNLYQRNEAALAKRKIKLYNNAYLGGIAVPETEMKAVEVTKGLLAPGTAPVDNANSTLPLAGKNVGDNFNGYVPVDGSELINGGVSLEKAVEAFGGTWPPATFTGENNQPLSPLKWFNDAKPVKSINAIAGNNMPVIDGVTYTTDFLGNELAEGCIPVGAILHTSKGTGPGTEAGADE